MLVVSSTCTTWSITTTPTAETFVMLLDLLSSKLSSNIFSFKFFFKSWCSQSATFWIYLLRWLLGFWGSNWEWQGRRTWRSQKWRCSGRSSCQHTVTDTWPQDFTDFYKGMYLAFRIKPNYSSLLWCLVVVQPRAAPHLEIGHSCGSYDPKHDQEHASNHRWGDGGKNGSNFAKDTHDDHDETTGNNYTPTAHLHTHRNTHTHAARKNDS